MAVATVLLEGSPVSELWAVPVTIIVYGTIVGFPIAFAGLLMLGLPLALTLGRWADRPWMPFMAFFGGALAGRVTYHLVDHAIFFGIDHLWSWRLADYGVLIGAPTGFIWFLFARRVLREQRIHDAPPDPLPS